ncbi:CRISPR-associated endonuclease Cas3'' [Acinetobacter soli]|uniref:CRISPR-associated endonuclease Cas3'' n=1 Tax=Acinetobacter soli TaxID=487316 RepID=UPI00124F97ED|nr:CRISPR-associated endonuclease Cas3'' [Acinetobacter soli]
MIVTFISQCEKKAIPRTRRVLDAFADRIGDNTWQTVITEDGLLAVKRLLKKTVTKNTAVSCHWIRGRRRSELMWIVGNRNKFNSEGIVPVNSTQKEVFMDVMTMKAKKDEFYANTHLQPLAEHLFAVGYLAQQMFKKIVGNDKNIHLETATYIAGCLHDLGKIDIAFQKWVRDPKNKDYIPDDGQHIDTKKGKVHHFENNPTHNELSLLLFHFFDSLRDGSISGINKKYIRHAIFWHHARPYRQEDKFKDVESVYNIYKNILSIDEFNVFFAKALDLLKRVHVISKKYEHCDINALNKLDWSLDDTLHNELIYKDKNYPNFKYYDLSKINFDEIQNSIQSSAKANITRSCVISADRLISSKSALELCEYIQEERLDELLDNQELSSNLVSHIENALSQFPNSERTKKQKEVAQKLAELRDVAVLAGAAGCGKTKIALEWAMLKNVQKIIWVCPRVQVCQGIFEELTTNYLPDANIEIFTGEFKFTNTWDKVTSEKDYFSGDIVVTTIDQILGSITTHSNVNALIPFVEAHVIFDEYHEYINMDIFNLLFAELIANKNMRPDSDKRVLLVSATPHYSYLREILALDIDEDVIEMPSFNPSQYQIQFVDYQEDDRSTNPFYQTYHDKTFVISNTAQTAQLSFLLQKNHENNVLFHSKFKRSDKKRWFNEVYESFKKDGSEKYDVLRSGPIVQASLNISCDHMLSEMSSPENILQRLGRLDRFGENQKINILTIALSEHIKNGKQIGASAKFLAKLNSLQSAKAWYNFLSENLGDKLFKLPELYELYKSFYRSSYAENEIKQDLKSAIKNSINLVTKKVTEPTLVIKTKTDEKKMKISKNSLRGDNRFVQLAKLDVNDYQHPVFLNEYAYVLPTAEKNEFDNLTENLSMIQNLGLIDFIAKKHGNIDPTHPVQGIKERQMSLRYKVLENFSKDAEYPLYLSYIEDDLNKVGGTTIRHSEAIYYAICDQQPIGTISIRNIQELKNTN